MKDDYYYQFSLPHSIYISFIKGWENVLSELGSGSVVCFIICIFKIKKKSARIACIMLSNGNKLPSTI